MILKLPHEGDTHTGHVTACSAEKGTYGEQVKFTFASGDLLYVGKPSADRQLLRCGFDLAGTVPPQVDYAAVAGNTLAFSRDHNAKAPDKPYWGITLAAPHEANPPMPTKRLPAPPLPSAAPRASAPSTATYAAATAPKAAAGLPEAHRPHSKATREDVAAAYRWALAESRSAQGEEAPYEAVQSGAATILIALDKQGLVAGFGSATLADVKRVLDLPDANADDLPF